MRAPHVQGCENLSKEEWRDGGCPLRLVVKDWRSVHQTLKITGIGTQCLAETPFWRGMKRWLSRVCVVWAQWQQKVQVEVLV